MEKIFNSHGIFLYDIHHCFNIFSNFEVEKSY